MSSSHTDSTTESVSAAASVSAAYAKLPASSLPNVDSLSNAVIYSFFASQSTSPQLDNEDLKQIDIDDLKEMDLRWQMAMLTMRARRFLQKTGRNLGANGPTSMGFDMSKVECYNFHRKGHFARECRSSKDPKRPGAAEPQRRTVPVETSTSNALVSQCDGTGSYDWSYQAEEELANFALMAFSSSSSDNETGLESIKARLLVYKQNESVFEENIKLFNIEVQLRDIALATLRHKLDKAEKDRDDLKLKLEKSQTSSKNLTELLASQTKSNCESWPPSSLYDRFQPSSGYHAVPPLYTETFMPPKPNLDLSHITRPSAPIIEDSFFDSKTESEPKALQFVSSFAQSFEHAQSPRHTVQQIEPTILDAPPVPASPKSNSSGQRRNRKACFVYKSMDHLIKDCDFHTKKMAQPTQRNYAHMGHHKQYASLTHSKPQKHMVPTVVLTQSKLVSKTVVRPVSASLPNITVTQPRRAYHVVTKSKSPIRRHTTHSLTSKTNNLPPRVTAVQALVVSATQGAQGTWVWRPKYPILDHDFQTTCASMILRRFDYNDALSRSKSNRVLVTKPHNKTPYELLHGRTPSIGFIRPFGCPVTILNTLDPLGKFQGNVDEGFLVGYSVCSKAFSVFNSRTHIIQETLHVNFLENKPNVVGTGPTWLFNIDSLAGTMNYHLVNARNQTNSGVGFQDKFAAEKAGEEVDQSYMLFLVWSAGSTNPHNNAEDAAFDGKEHDFDVKKPDNEVNAAGSIVLTVGQNSLNSTNTFSVVGPLNDVVSPTYGKSSFLDASQHPDDPDMPELEDITYSDDEDVVGVEADFNNLGFSIPEEPKRVHQALKDLSWIKAVQEELLQFKMQKVWVLVDLPYGKRAIGTKWVYKNKKDERGIVIRNKAKLVAQGHTQEERIDYKEVFALVARIEAIILFLAYASFVGFMVYQMDVKGVFLYGTIEKEVYVCQPSWFEDLDHPDKVYKVVKALYGLHQAPRACQDKYVAEILRKFRLTEGKSASTPIDTKKPLLKDSDGEDVDVHTYRSMIGSLMYLTSLRPDIMFATNDVTRLQALVDRKKVVITEAAIRDVLRLDDAEGSMSAKRTPWNEFSSTMAYAVICLSTGIETPLFKGMLVAGVIEEEGDAEEQVQDDVDDAAQGADTAVQRDDVHEPYIPSPTPPTPPPQLSQYLPSTSQEALDACAALTRRFEHLEYDKVAQALEITKLKRRVKKLEKGNRVKVLKLRRLQKVGTSQRIDTSEDTVMEDASNQGRMIDDLDKDDEDDPAEVQEVVDVVTTAKLITEVVTAASKTVTVASITISTAEPQVSAAAITTAALVRVAAASTRRRKGVVIRDPEEDSTTIIPSDTKSKDKGKGIMVEESNPMKKKQQVKMDEEYARKLHEVLNKDIDWDVAIKHVKKKSKEDPFVQRYQVMKKRPQIEA
nr:putative ribonuclease H-like domain-containing protein [Tanacetum cinerariifolium]